MTASQAPDQFRTKMVALTERFQARSKEQHQELVSLTQTNELAVQELESIHRIAHSLAGSAGLFGFCGVARQAATVEDEILAEANTDIIVRQVGALCSVIETEVLTGL